MSKIHIWEEGGGGFNLDGPIKPAKSVSEMDTFDLIKSAMWMAEYLLLRATSSHKRFQLTAFFSFWFLHFEKALVPTGFCQLNVCFVCVSCYFEATLGFMKGAIQNKVIIIILSLP